MKFKKLTVENWMEIDPVSNLMVNMRTDEKLSGDFWAGEILRPELNENVPLELVEIFEVARSTMLYGWYFYPLYTHGVDQLSQLLDSAAYHKCEIENAPKKVKRFVQRVEWLIANGFIKEERRQQWDAGRSLRNSSAHRTKQHLLNQGMAMTYLYKTTEILNELFEA